MGCPLIKLSATEVTRGVSGESEELIRDLFDQAAVNVLYFILIFLIEIFVIRYKILKF